MLFTIDLHEDFVNVEGITVASMASLQSSSVNGAEFDAPQADRFSGDSDPTLCQKVFNISVAEIESEVQPNSIADDVGWESVSFIGIHEPILSIWVT